MTLMIGNPRSSAFIRGQNPNAAQHMKKLALVGYGKMGRILESLAPDQFCRSARRWAVGLPNTEFFSVLDPEVFE